MGIQHGSVVIAKIYRLMPENQIGDEHLIGRFSDQIYMQPRQQDILIDIMPKTLITPPLADNARTFQICIGNIFFTGQRMLAMQPRTVSGKEQ